MSKNEANELNLKLILIGDSNVGKTTLLYKYIDDEIKDDITPTVGLENKVKTIQIKGINAKIQIWDTAGQEKFNSLTKNFFTNTDGILIIFDLTNKTSFTNIKNWIEDVKDKQGHKIKKIIVGNKADLKDKRKVTKEDIKSKTEKYKYIEVSAVNGNNVEKAFDTLIKAIVGKRTDEELIADFGMDEQILSLSGSTINNVNKEKKKKCCK